MCVWGCEGTGCFRSDKDKGRLEFYYRTDKWRESFKSHQTSTVDFNPHMCTLIRASPWPEVWPSVGAGFCCYSVGPGLCLCVRRCPRARWEESAAASPASDEENGRNQVGKLAQDIFSTEVGCTFILVRDENICQLAVVWSIKRQKRLIAFFLKPTTSWNVSSTTQRYQNSLWLID